MSEYYSTKEAAELTGASRQIIRTYTASYQRFFSTDGAPQPGQQRRFTSADLRLIRYIYESTQSGVTHTEVAERLQAGALEQFAWQAPEEPAASAQAAESAASATSTALVPLERLQAAHALMQDAQRREQAAAEQIATLQAEVQRLSQALGRAEGEAATLKASRYRAPTWWRRLFGGRQGE